MKKVISMILSMVILFSMCCIGNVSVSATQRDDIVSIARGQIGYHGRPNTFTYWMGTVENSYNYAWCATFVSWCANQTGLTTDIIPRHTSCTYGMNWFKERGLWQYAAYYGGSYTPKAGDIVYYSDNYTQEESTHVGIVTGLNGNYLTVVEGNTDDNRVTEYTANSKRTLTSGYVLGYATPNYSDDYLNIGTNFTALILNTVHWKPIENRNNNVVLNTEDKSKNQLWYFERQIDNSYKITSLYDNTVLDLDNYGTVDGTNIKTCESNDTDAQRWFFVQNGNGYSIIPKCSQNGAMDLDGNISDDGTNLHFWSFHGGDAQTFTVYKIENINQYLSRNIGDEFNALIINSACWKPIENKNNNVVLNTEDKTKKQIWNFVRQEDNSYKIISLYDDSVLDLDNYGTANGTNIKTCQSNDTDAQRWYLIENEGGFSFVPKCSPDGAMDLDGNNSDDGTNLHYWTFHGGESQIFTIYQIDSVIQYLSKDIGNNFVGLIKNTNNGKPIENYNNNVVLNTENKTKNQLWKFEQQDNNSYKIISLYDNTVMDLDNYGTEDGTNIKTCQSNDTDAQRWYFIENDTGYSIIPKCSQNGAMDLNGNNSEDGTNLHFWTFHGGSAQTYSITKIENLEEYLFQCILGDVNNDDVVNIIDATELQKYIVESITLDEDALLRADVDCNGTVDIKDATLIQKYCASIITEF